MEGKALHLANLYHYPCKTEFFLVCNLQPLQNNSILQTFLGIPKEKYQKNRFINFIIIIIIISRR